MADGENDGLWGDITNDNLEILGRAISGVTTVTLAGTTHTLTVSQGALSEGHFMVLELGGSPTGTNTITINPNTVERLYFVKNGSGEDAVFTQGSGGNVTVPNGANAIIYCDGAGSGAKVTDFTSNLLRSSNNLSDLGDAATALTNLGLTATAAELNTLDGITSTTGELNLLDGVTWSLTDYNTLTATAAELNVLDGVTWSLTDYNTLTATAAELNLLDGITASTAELNKLDGLTATTTELNYVDGVTSAIQTQLDAKYEAATQSTATWEAGTSTTESLVSPAKVKAAIDNNQTGNRYESGWVAATYPATFTHGLGQTPQFYQLQARALANVDGYSVGDVVMLIPHADGDGARRTSSYANSTQVVFPQAPKGGTPNGSFVVSFAGSNWEIKMIALKELR